MTEKPAVGDGRAADKPSALIRVLSQVRWPVMSGFVLDSVADDLAVRIGKDYPLRQKGQEFAFLLTPEGVTQQAGGGTLHQFTDSEQKWTVTLAPTFITLETTAYSTHEDFIPRFVAVVRELKGHLPLQRWDRFGYRYTNRISDESDVAALRELFVPEVLGPLALDFADDAVHSAGETVYEGQGCSLLVKSAFLPPNASVEATIPPIAGRSWLLDLDAFVNGPSGAFADDEIGEQANLLRRKAHDFFERVITDEYRARFAS